MPDQPELNPKSSPAAPASVKRNGITVGEVFQRAYRILYSKLLGVLVILAMAVVSLAGTVIAQAPMSKHADPQGYAQWLEVARAKYGGWTVVLDKLGFFALWTSPLFLGITVLLTMSIIACTTHRLPLLVKKTRHPRIRVSDRFFTHAQYRAVIPRGVEGEAALDALRSVLGKRHFRMLTEQSGTTTHIYADRFRYGPFGTVLAHASFVIILLAFAVSGFTGFETNLEAPIGAPVEVGHETGLTVEATSFEDSYDEQGRPLDYVSHLVLRRGDQVVAEQDVRVNSPLVFDSVRFHQASFGIGAQVRVENQTGQNLVDGMVALKWTSGDGLNSIGRVDLPEVDRQIIVVTAASGQTRSSIEPGTAVFEIYQLSTGQRLGSTVVNQGDTEELEGMKLSFLREQRYTGLLVRKDPGTIWMWIGSALLVVGMLMTYGMRHRRIWVKVVSGPQCSKIYLAAVETPDVIFEKQFREIATALQEEDGARAASERNLK